MAATYTTAVGDDLDLICFRHYGQQAGAVEDVLLANPTIRGFAFELPVGTEIVLPDRNAASRSSGEVSLWD